MKLFNVYSLLPIDIERAAGARLWDTQGREYLDFYGGHAVISIGHSHPYYIKKIKDQLEKIGFYSNSVVNRLQEELAEKLGRACSYEDYQLFLCNSGAEANENALKAASFTTGKKKFITFRSSFHGRTSAAVAATDDSSIVAPVNETDHFIFCPLNDFAAFSELFATYRNELAGVIIEGIQGIGGIHIAEPQFLKLIEKECNSAGVFFICDEIQSGYGRTGRFFAHQYAGVAPHIITVAKGMANGFPIGAVLISPQIPAKPKMMGTTFGGNHLACAAAIAVLDIMKQDQLIGKAERDGSYFGNLLQGVGGLKEVRGKGLMWALDFDYPASGVSKRLREESGILTGSANHPNTMRLLPPLTVKRSEMDYFVQELRKAISQIPL